MCQVFDTVRDFFTNSQTTITMSFFIPRGRTLCPKTDFAARFQAIFLSFYAFSFYISVENIYEPL